MSRRQIYIEWRECLRWHYEDQREAWRRDSHLYRTAGKSFKEVKEPNWREVEPDWEALYPERRRSEPTRKMPSQWELYQAARASGRLADIEHTRHQRQALDFDGAKRRLSSG